MVATENLISVENKERCIKELQDIIPVKFSSGSPEKSAAVLIPLIKCAGFQGNVGILYTKRSPFLRSHAREVCFPGGRVDPNETPIQAAIRESYEELGIDENQLDIWTTLPPLPNKTSGTKGIKGSDPFTGTIKLGITISTHHHKFLTSQTRFGKSIQLHT